MKSSSRHLASEVDARPIRSETRAILINAIARGRQWMRELVENRDATAETIARHEGCSARKVTMTISLAFLSPALVKVSAYEGSAWWRTQSQSNQSPGRIPWLQGKEQGSSR